ncbi:MAG: PH domain-containing protein [Oscillospiraceae bacterium]|jgi:membrane protein YdbS with pleckstrin-like domain|nr:PH domain-containing protein [Oscillospiraceae bacterium]
MEYQRLSKKALGVLAVTAALQALFSAGLLFALFALAKRFLWQGLSLWPAGLFVAVAALLYCALLPPFRHMRYRYHLGEDRVEIIEGAVFISRTIVPIDRIYQIQVSRGPIDSLFGVAKVVITTGGGTATFRFLELAKADALGEQLNAVVRKKIQAGGGQSHV